MVLYRNLPNLLLVLVIAAMLAGCEVASPAATPEMPSPAQTKTEVRGDLVGAAGLTPTATTELAATPVVTTTPDLTPLPLETPPARPRFPAGWGYYSNPDFVEGLAVHDNKVWVASLGGVISWDLETELPTFFTTREGLVEIQGNDIVFCAVPAERIIVAHETNTLSAYDLGQKKWIRMPITFDDGSTLSSVQTLFCDSKNNRLIAGSPDGLGILRFDTLKWSHIGVEEGLTSESILSIDVVGQSIWIAAGDKSAYLIMGRSVFPFNATTGFSTGPVYDVSIDSSGAVWIAYPTSLVRYKDQRWTAYNAQKPTGIPFSAVNQVEVGHDGTIWIANAEQGVCPFSQTLLFCSTIYPGLLDYKITKLIVDDNGVAYAGTNGGGVLVLRTDQVTNLAVRGYQLMSNDVLDIAESADGRLWIATGQGVNVFDPAHPDDVWQTIRPARNKLIYPRVSGLQAAADGMWFFYENEEQASFFDGENWLQIDLYKGITSPVLDSAVDQRGYLWMAAEQGIHIWDGVTMRFYGPSTGLPGSTFRALFENGGEMWVGTDRGLLHYQRYQWESLLPNISINTITTDRPNGLLLGTDQGLIRYANGQSYQWMLNIGNDVITDTRVTSAAWDLTGHLWVGTDGDGLFHFDGKQWERFDTSRGMPTNRIQKILTDRTGTLWILAATGKGGGAIVRYTP
jgi:ligand-binding sensor domain-containing protein